MDIRAEIILLTGDPNTPRTAAEIHRLLGQQEEFQGRVPSRRTVERIVHELAQQRSPATWHWSDYGAEDARILLHVMDELIEHHLEPDDPDLGRLLIAATPDFFRSSLIESKEAADWIVRIARVAPDLSPSAVYIFALAYLVQHQVGASTSGLDTYLAMRPWKDSESAVRYLRALHNKLIPAIPIQEGMFVQALMEYYEIGPDLEPRGARDPEATSDAGGKE